MKYKSSELELPPLGEIIVVKDENNTFIGEFYINAKKERKFNDRLDFDPYYSCVELKNGYKWTSLPKFKSIKQEKPPVGIDALFGCTARNEGVLNSFSLCHFIKGQQRQYVRDNTNDKEILVDAWLPLEAFEEE